MAAEASPDAQAPVTLALMKLAAMYGLDWFTNVSLQKTLSLNLYSKCHGVLLLNHICS